MNIYKKVVSTFFLSIFALTIAFAPRPAEAFFADVIGGPTAVIKYVWERVESVYAKVQGIVGAELTNRTVSMFLDSLAYDVANELATGGPGNKPSFRTVSIEKSLQKAQDAALGEFLGELTEKGFDDLGINLCNPSLELKLSFTLALIDEERPPKPDCNWRNVQNNWKRFSDNIQADIVRFQLDPKRSGVTSTIDFFNQIVSNESTDLGTLLTLKAELNNRRLAALEVEKITAAECQGFQDSKTTITEEVKTHCSVKHGIALNLLPTAIQTDVDRQLSQKEAATNQKLSAIIRDASNRFISTFSSKLLKNWIQRGMWSLFGDDEGDVISKYKDSLLDRLRGGSNLRQPGGIDIFKDFRKVNIETIESYSYINDFAICPSSFRKPDNCIMSPGLLQAVNNNLTIVQAIEQGLIDGDTPLIHPNDAINHTIDKCYRDGFCYANLVKLRKANIVPVGWELAALRAPVSLQQAIDCFEESTKCEFQRSADYQVDGNDHNPFYHLIDPDWVLKAPAVRCDANVFGSVLESPESPNRQEYCADPKVCLRQDDQGNCIEDQYSYCTRSENIWNFEGTSCLNGEVYAGCLTFNNADFGSASYIESSLEYCSSDQAGCARYSQDKDSNGDWVFDPIDIDDNDLFLNAQADDCPSDRAGCSQYIAMAPGTGANLIANGDFEINEDADPNRPDGFDEDGVLVAGEGVSGSNAVSAVYIAPGSHQITCYNDLVLMPNTNYTVSVDVRLQAPAGSGPARIGIGNCVDSNGYYGGLTSPDSSMEVVNDNGSGLPANEANLLINANTLSSTEFNRISGTFNSGNSVYCSNLCIGANYGNGNPHYFDNLKWEAVSQVPITSSFSPYGEGATIYMDGETFMCSADEVGCQGYYPDNGDPMIPAVISQSDLCPAECVGYDNFAEQPDHFDIVEGDILPEYYNFIPETARSCPVKDVGCEEFTNLEEVAQGGEGREYYTYLRQCVRQDLGTFYYTWEGSDVSGYQIKTWYALESNLSDAPCTNVAPGGDVCLDVAFGQPVLDAPNEVAACDISTNDPSDDIGVNPNCREFLDEQGDAHYRLQDRVVLASNDCKDYRRTLSGQVYKALADESTTCSAANNGCREYNGDTANNIRQVLSDNFEGGSYSPWAPFGPQSDLDLSNESLNNNGHSLRAETGRGFLRDISNAYIQNNKEYRLSWWMKSNSVVNTFTLNLLAIDNNSNVATQLLIDPTADPNFRNIEPGRWHYYTTSVYIDTLGAIDLNDLDTFQLIFNTTSPLDDQGLYIDNFIVKEVGDSFTVVRNSWTTPVSCDQPYEGYHLGCQSYRDTNGRQYNLKSFSHLCREGAIGCIPVIDTHNSSNPFEETFNAGDYSELTVPADSIAYLVPNPSNYCPSAFKGCTQLGIASYFDPESISTTYLINDPDTYATTLCSSEGLNCAEFETDKGTYYFKAPGNQTCTYQQNVLIADNLLSGWFKTNTLADEVPVGCSDENGVFEVADLDFPRNYCHTVGDPADILNFFTSADCLDNGGEWTNGLADPANWAALCPATENLCTDFRDPSDPVGCDPKIDDPSIEGYCSDNVYDNKSDCERNNETWTPRCNDYYYYADANIDESSCDGLVDRDQGCVLFYDANNWNAEHSQVSLYYDTAETYENIEVADRGQSPVACNPSFDPSCNLDANKLIKVNKDRQCAEWLACKSSTATYDEEAQEYRIICDDLDSCIEFQYDPDSNTTKCKKWASYDEDVEALTFEKYQSRDTGFRNHISWSDKEYIGYSVPNTLPVSELVVYNFAQDTGGRDTRLVYDVVDSADALGLYYEDCVDINGDSLDGLECSAILNRDGEYYFRGECHQRVCWINPKVNENTTSTFAIETRAYSIAEAPFPAAIEVDGIERLSSYDQANICINNASSPNSCEESFRQVTYGRDEKVLFYPKDAIDGEIPNGICTSGITTQGPNNNSLKTCDKNYECDSFDELGNRRGDGNCALRTEEIVFQNWPGICLEYDYTHPVVKDGRNSYYCNQWYPAQKIKGTDSLYDNYQMAGYYEQSGRDALFCAVAEPYVTTQDRYYCGYFTTSGEAGGCNVLMKVPAGSKVNLNMAASYIELLDEDSWMTEGEDFDIWDWSDNNVERDIILTPYGGPSPYGDSPKFNRYEHFGNVMPSEVNFMDIIAQLFDTYDVVDPNTGLNVGIHRFYFDDNVRPDGTSSDRAFVNIPGVTYREHHSQCEDCPGQTTCSDPTVHTVYQYCKKTVHCGWHMWRHRNIYCNPYIYNYYVDVNSGDEPYVPPAPQFQGSCTQDCIFTSDIDLETNHGRGCLQDSGLSLTYATILDTYASSTAPGGFDQAACNAGRNNYDCSFVACIQTRDIPDQNASHFCTLYDDCFQYLRDGNNNLTATYELWAESIGCFDDGDHDDDPNTPIVGGDGFGPLSMYDPDQFDACIIAYEDDFTNWRGEVDEQELAEFCSSCTLVQNPETHGTVDLGVDCGDDLACYQQCRIIGNLDSEGLLSAVRTDIWWRNEQANARIRAIPWSSWYWSPGLGYVSSTGPASDDDEVLFYEIAAFPAIVGDYPENFSHFGAGFDVFSPDRIVSTRVPYYRESPDNITAATFFARINNTTDLDQALNFALAEMQDIFFRVYQMEWSAVDSAYLYDGSVNLSGGNNTNNFAGPDYRPRILATCGDDICEILDNDGNVTGVEEGFTINGKRSGNLIGLDASLFTNVKFFYHAHPDHMPVYSIDVDWGDSPVSIFIPNPGKYKNSLPSAYCDPEADAPGLDGELMGFGGLDRACRSGYKVFYHDYLYDEGGTHACNGGPGAPGTPNKPVEPNASCYQPRIRVVDNWGWDQVVPFDGWIVVHDE